MRELILAVLLCASVGLSSDDPPREVDWIELNTVQTECGLSSLRQIVFWGWSVDYKRYDCLGWVLVESVHDSDMPRKVGDRWVMRCRGQRFSARVFSQTWTATDPEVGNRDLFPPECRGIYGWKAELFLQNPR